MDEAQTDPATALVWVPVSGGIVRAVDRLLGNDNPVGFTSDSLLTVVLDANRLQLVDVVSGWFGILSHIKRAGTALQEGSRLIKRGYRVSRRRALPGRVTPNRCSYSHSI